MTIKKVFYRKTKRGNVLKTVRQHYLREDIPCGADFCVDCSQFLNDEEDIRTHILSNSSLYKISDFEKNPFLIPDTNVVLHQVCIF